MGVAWGQHGGSMGVAWGLVKGFGMVDFVRVFTLVILALFIGKSPTIKGRNHFQGFGALTPFDPYMTPFGPQINQKT